jgi:Zn-finger nucleic acid-binding protein
LLREFHGRLVCDQCQGVLMTEPDLVGACRDLNNVEVEVAVGDETRQRESCPRCGDPMQLAQLTIAGKKSKAFVLRCGKDGLWLPQRGLAHVLAVSTRGGAMGIQHGGPGLAGGASPTNADGHPTAARGPATAALRIGQWHQRRKTSPKLTPINIYADRTLACPACDAELAFGGDRWSCVSCAGTFLQNETLEGLVLDMSGSAWSVPPPEGPSGARKCPVCEKLMLVEDIERVLIDRCASHGLWFDAKELAVALERASGQFDATGIRAWLSRLF